MGSNVPRLAACIVLAAVFGAPIATGSIATGLRPTEGIRVQEYATDGQLHYCIYNARADSVVLTMREYWRVNYHEEQANGLTLRVSGGRAVTGDTLAELSLAPGEFARLPAPEVPDGRLVEFIANGARMGVVPGYHPQPYGALLPIAVWSNLDCPGHRNDGFWTEHSSLWVRSGEEFTVDLVLAKGAGEVRIDKTPGRIPEDLPEDTLLVPYEVASRSLVVVESSEEFTISASAPELSEGTHRAKLYFRAPEVQSRTLMLFGGFRWAAPGSGHTVIRAVLVEPVGEGSLPPN